MAKERIGQATSHLWTLAHATIPLETVGDCIDADDNRVLECALEGWLLVSVLSRVRFDNRSLMVAAQKCAL